jgi:hypothetical protein
MRNVGLSASGEGHSYLQSGTPLGQASRVQVGWLHFSDPKVERFCFVASRCSDRWLRDGLRLRRGLGDRLGGAGVADVDG